MRNGLRSPRLFLFAAMGSALLLLYLYLQAYSLITGPTLLLNSPASGETLQESLITVSGTAQHISFLTLNGAPIYADNAGRFSEQLLLSEGYTIMTILAKDRFGRERSQNIELLYTPHL